MDQRISEGERVTKHIPFWKGICMIFMIVFLIWSIGLALFIGMTHPEWLELVLDCLLL